MEYIYILSSSYYSLNFCVFLMFSLCKLISPLLLLFFPFLISFFLTLLIPVPPGKSSYCIRNKFEIVPRLFISISWSNIFFPVDLAQDHFLWNINNKTGANSFELISQNLPYSSQDLMFLSFIP